MVFFLIPVIIAAISAVAIGEVVRRPLQELFEGQILTEEAPVRTALTMYVSGVADLDYFKYVMRSRNVQEKDQAVYIAYANKRIADKAEGEALQQLKSVTTQLNKINTVYDKLDDDADDIELDAFVQDTKNKIVDLDLDRDAIKTMLTKAVSKGTEAPVLEGIKLINSEIARLNMTVFDKRAEIMDRKKARINQEYSAVQALQPTLPAALTAAEYKPISAAELAAALAVPTVTTPLTGGPISALVLPAPGTAAPGPTPAPTAAPVAAGTAHYTITSVPSPADVYFNNVLTGQSPLEITMPATTGYEIAVGKLGYDSVRLQTSAESGKSYSWNFLLAITPTTTGAAPLTGFVPAAGLSAGQTNAIASAPAGTYVYDLGGGFSLTTSVPRTGLTLLATK